MAEVLLEFGAEGLRVDFFGGSADKMRAHFIIKNSEKALECYNLFYLSRVAIPGARTIIFLHKNGMTFTL